MTSPVPSENSAPASSCSKTCRVCSLPPDDSPIAYAAGIFDGEGSLVISSTTTNGRTRYWPMMVVQMTKPHALNVLWATLGGRLGPVARHGRGPGYAGVLRWELSGAAMRCPLTAMLPFLRVKTDQASLVLEMLGRDWPPSTNGRGICWTPEVSAEWQKAKDRIHELNRRGMAVTDGAIAQRVGDQWMIPQVDLFGERWETFSGRFPASGSMRNGSIFEHPPSAPPTGESGSSSSPGLPAPRARDARGRGFEDALPNVVQLLPTPTVSEANGIGHAADGGMNLRHTISLLPTPAAADGERQSTAYSRGNPTLAGALLPTPTATPYGNNQSPSPGATVRPSLDSLAPTLLPTPTVADSRGTRNHRPDGTPYSSGYGTTLTDATTLLPTPRATDDTKGGPNQRGSSGDLTLPSAAHRVSSGASTSPRSAAGNTPSGDSPPPPPTLWDD